MDMFNNTITIITTIASILTTIASIITTIASIITTIASIITPIAIIVDISHRMRPAQFYKIVLQPNSHNDPKMTMITWSM